MKDTFALQAVLAVHAGILAGLSFSDLDIAILAWVAAVDAIAFTVLIVRDMLVDLYES